MGQTHGLQSGTPQYVHVRQLPMGNIVREEATNRLHFVKEYSFTSQQAFQQSFLGYSKKLSEKHEHIFSLQRTTTKVENTFCSTFYKIGLVYQYIDHTLAEEIVQRKKDAKAFDEKEIWSVLCSCALAMTEMIRMEGRSHAALRTRDIRLTKEGVVKILSMEMVGIEVGQDAAEEGSTKQLAMTVLNCLLMEDVSNDAREFLEELIEAAQSTDEMKTILHLMVDQRTQFADLEEYLFKLVQEETDSLASCSNTPMVTEKSKTSKPYAHIKEDVKYEDVIDTIPHDPEDRPQSLVHQIQTCEHQLADENDQFEESKAGESCVNTLREKNQHTDSRVNTQQKGESRGPYEDSNPRLSYDNKQHYSQSQSMFGKTYKLADSHEYTGQFECSLFTDPKLLDLIHSDLEEIKKRNSIDPRALREHNEPVEDHSRDHIIENNVLENHARNNHIKDVNNRDANGKQNYTKKGGDSLDLTSERLVKQAKALDNNFKTMSNPKIIVSEPNMTKHSRDKSKSNLEARNANQVQSEIQYDNIMQNEDIGFRKKKPTKIQQPESNAIESAGASDRSQGDLHETFEKTPASSNLYRGSNNRSETQDYREEPRQEPDQKETRKMEINTQFTSISKVNEQPKNAAKDMGQNQSNGELEYVTETYVKGKYEGTKLNGMRHGKGVFYYNEGGKYVGSWKENQMHGKGVLYYPNNQIAYEGDWKCDQLSGFGTLYNEEVCDLKTPFDYRDWSQVDDYWIKYEGKFLNDNKEGEGKLFIVNGEILEAQFKNDMVSGEGILYRKDGNRVKGLWRDNKLIRMF